MPEQNQSNSTKPPVTETPSDKTSPFKFTFSDVSARYFIIECDNRFLLSLWIHLFMLRKKSSYLKQLDERSLNYLDMAIEQGCVTIEVDPDTDNKEELIANTNKYFEDNLKV